MTESYGKWFLVVVAITIFASLGLRLIIRNFPSTADKAGLHG